MKFVLFLRYAVMPDDTESDLFGDDIDENSDDEGLDDAEVLQKTTNQPMWVLPLYSILPSHEQAKVSYRLSFGRRVGL